MSVETPKEVRFPLYLRIPVWCHNPKIDINNEQIVLSVKDGFVRIEREWDNGDKLNLRFPMSVSLVRGKETPYPPISYFHRPGSRPASELTHVENPYESIFYGPLLFALPLADENENKQVQGQTWNYALDIKDETVDVKVQKMEMPSPWHWQLKAPVKLVVNAKSFDWQPNEMQPLPKDEIEQGVDTWVTLIPYGCTKFRVSMFPVSK
ncbi:MAG: hypothetical protein AB2L24_30535 [Mangrovibacterium sp.]